MKSALKIVLDCFVAALVELDEKEGTNYSERLVNLSVKDEKKILGFVQRDIRKQLIHVTQEGGHHEHP
jgi:hypothetical protein